MNRTLASSLAFVVFVSIAQTSHADDGVSPPPRNSRSGLTTGIVLTSVSGASAIAGAALLVFSSLGPPAFMIFASINCFASTVGTAIPGLVLMTNSLHASALPREGFATVPIVSF